MNEQLLTDEQGYDGKKHFGQTFNYRLEKDRLIERKTEQKKVVQQKT